MWIEGKEKGGKDVGSEKALIGSQSRRRRETTGIEAK
jgi:hypothetical protein